MGSAVTVASAIWEKDPNGCAVDPANYKLGLVMYVSYFWLFFGASAPSTPFDASPNGRCLVLPPPRGTALRWMRIDAWSCSFGGCWQ